MPDTIVGSVVVAGGGITGMQAALDLADSGFLVHLIEESSAIPAPGPGPGPEPGSNGSQAKPGAYRRTPGRSDGSRTMISENNARIGFFICHCGSKATMVIRLDEHGNTITEGSQVVIGGNDRYVSLCRKHFRENYYGQLNRKMLA